MASPTVQLDDSALESMGASDFRGAWSIRRQLSVVTVAWMFGSIWSNVVTGASITAFARGLGASHLQFGLLAALPYVAALFSVPGSLLVERTGDRKRLFLDLFITQRLLCTVVAVAPLVMLAMYGPLALPHAMVLVLGLLALMHCAGAAGGPAWVSWMADVVPQRIRGTYFARRRQWGIVTAVPAAILVGWGLDKLSGRVSPVAGVPSIVFWGAVVLAVSTFFGLMDILLFAPLPHARKPPQRGSGLLKSMLVPLRDRPFMTLSIFVGVINFTVGFTNQFATVFAMERLGIDNMHAGLMLIATPMLVQWLMLPAWGTAVDRMGRKPLLVLAGIGLVPTAFGWVLMGQAPHIHWLGYVLFACAMTLWTGIEVANFNCVIDAGDRRNADGSAAGGSAYHAVNTVIINLAGCAGGVIAGLVARSLDHWTWQPFVWLNPVSFYDVLFTFSGVVRFAAIVVLTPLLIEPTAKSLSVTVRFLASFTIGRFASQLRPVVEWMSPRPQEAEEEADPIIAGVITADATSSEVRPAA